MKADYFMREKNLIARIGQLESKLDRLNERVASHIAWQDEKTGLQEETVNIILDIIQAITQMLTENQLKENQSKSGQQFEHSNQEEYTLNNQKPKTLKI